MKQLIAALSFSLVAASLFSSCATTAGAGADTAPAVRDAGADASTARTGGVEADSTRYGPVLDPARVDYYHIDSREHIRRIEGGLRPIEVIPTGESEDTGEDRSGADGVAADRFGGSTGALGVGGDR